MELTEIAQGKSSKEEFLEAIETEIKEAVLIYSKYPQSSDEVNNLCSYPMDNTRGVCCSARKNLETFE